MDDKKRDVIIIGGGVVGVCIAYYTALEGASVLLLEKGRVGCGSSYGNAGLLVPSQCIPLPSPGVIAQGVRYLFDPGGPFYVRPRPDLELARWFWRFCRCCNERHLHHSIGVFRKLNTESLELHTELAAAGGSHYEFKQDGILSLFIDDREFSESLEYSSRVRIYGIETSVFSGKEIREMEPSIGQKVVGGLLHRMDGCLDPAAFVSWLAGEAKSRGAVFLENTEVFWLETDRRRVTKIVTTHGDFTAEQVVLAGGAWNAQLAGYLGTRIPIQAAKGYSLTFHPPKNAPKVPFLLEEARVAVTPYAESLRLAGTLELAGMDLGINRRRLETIQSRTFQYMPRLEIGEIKEIWRGLRPCTPDGLPILGRIRPYENALMAGGHGTKGMLLGPITGKYICRMLGGESIGMLERSLKPNRF